MPKIADLRGFCVLHTISTAPDSSGKYDLCLFISVQHDADNQGVA